MTSYKVISDAPNDYKKTAVYVDVFTADTYLNPNLGSALKVETALGRNIMPWLQVKYSWADASTKHVVTDFPKAPGGLKKQLVIDAGSVYFLANRNKKKRIKVVLSATSFGGYSYTRYMMVPGTVKRMFGVEGGLYYNRRCLQFGDQGPKSYHYQNATGYDQPIGLPGTVPVAQQPSGSAQEPLAMTHIFSIYGGLHYRKVRNLEINADGYGHKSNATVIDMYADIMLAPYITISDVVDVAGKEWKIVSQSGAIRHLGWKAGMTYHGAKKASLEYNFEFGRKPAPILASDFFGGGSYIAMGMGFSLGFDKQLAMKEHTKKEKTVPDERTQKD
jgi:hypothetical protein